MWMWQVPVSSGAVSDRIAEVVEAFPCLKFRVRLVFRHRLRACPSLTDAISIFSRSKWWGSEILMYPLSIVSLIAEYAYATNRTRAQMRPAGTVFFTPPLRPPQNTSDVICGRRTYTSRCRNLNGQESSGRQGEACYKFVILDN